MTDIVPLKCLFVHYYGKIDRVTPPILLVLNRMDSRWENRDRRLVNL